MGPGWVGLAAFARERGVPTWTMRRWALALDHEVGGLLRWNRRKGKPRKYWVHPERMKAALERDPNAHEAEQSFFESRLARVEEKCEALKKGFKSTKAEQKQLAWNFARWTSSDIVGRPAPVTK